MKEGIFLEPLSETEYNQLYTIACRLMPDLKDTVTTIQCFHDYSEGSTHKYAVYHVVCTHTSYVLKKTNQEEVSIYTKYLHTSSFKVPKFYAALQDGQDFWVLTSFIPGCNGKLFTKEIASRLAKNLTAILNAHWTEQGIAAAPDPTRFTRYWERITLRRKCLEQYPNLAQAYDRFLERQQTCPLSLCNGDLMQVNMICNEQDVYLIDWAFGGFLPYALEIARVIAHGTDDGAPFYMTDALRAYFMQCVYKQLEHTQLSFEAFQYDVQLACLNEHIEFLEYAFNHPEAPRDTYFDLDFHRATQLAERILANTSFKLGDVT
ncbi:MAG: phosphotransferase [Cellulosilyticaceae bacterium]